MNPTKRKLTLQRWFFVLHTIFLLSFLLVAPAWAIPVLQLYLEGATYDPNTQSWVLGPTGPITLWVMGNVSGPGGMGAISNVTLFAAFPDSVPLGASISLSPTTTSLSGWTDLSAPSSPTGGVTRDTSGTTPASLAGQGGHGVYGPPTDWFSFSLGSLSATNESVADLSPPCDPATSNCSNTLSGQINAYQVTLNGQLPFVHFDVSGTIIQSGNTMTVFAPFTHDASVVPEPGTLVLLGSGITSLAAWGWRRRSRSERGPGI